MKTVTQMVVVCTANSERHNLYKQNATFKFKSDNTACILTLSAMLQNSLFNYLG